MNAHENDCCRYQQEGWKLLIGEKYLRSRHFQFICFAVSFFIIGTLPLPGFEGNALDKDVLLHRLRTGVELNESQVGTMTPMAEALCASLQEIKQTLQNGTSVDTDRARRDIQQKVESFQNGVSAHLNASQQKSFVLNLQEWLAEIFPEALETPRLNATPPQASGSRINLSVSSPGFENSLGSSMTQLSDMQTMPADASDAGDGTANRGEMAIAPFPIVNPTIGNGIVLVAAYYRRLNGSDKVSPPSVFGAGGMYTDTHSWAAGYGNKLFLKQDRFRILGGFGFAQMHYDYSLGDEGSAESDIAIPIHQRGFGFLIGGQVRTYKRWYLGMRYGFLSAKTSVDLNEFLPGLPVDIEPFTLDIHLAGLTAQIERDTRDSQSYPRRGSSLSIDAGFNEKDLGSDFNHQKYEITYKGFRSLGKRQVLAYTVSGCGIKGDAPFFHLCMLGSASDLRGYAMGKYQDRRMLVGQAEYRLELPWRLGVTGFMGAGEVARQWSDFTWNSLRPGGGLGLRFVLAKMNHINLRADIAWGKGSSAWYVGLGEAF